MISFAQAQRALSEITTPETVLLEIARFYPILHPALLQRPELSPIVLQFIYQYSSDPQTKVLAAKRLKTTVAQGFEGADFPRSAVKNGNLSTNSPVLTSTTSKPAHSFNPVTVMLLFALVAVLTMSLISIYFLLGKPELSLIPISGEDQKDSAIKIEKSLLSRIDHKTSLDRIPPLQILKENQRAEDLSGNGGRQALEVDPYYPYAYSYYQKKIFRLQNDRWEPVTAPVEGVDIRRIIDGIAMGYFTTEHNLPSNTYPVFLYDLRNKKEIFLEKNKKYDDLKLVSAYPLRPGYIVVKQNRTGKSWNNINDVSTLFDRNGKYLLDVKGTIIGNGKNWLISSDLESSKVYLINAETKKVLALSDNISTEKMPLILADGFLFDCSDSSTPAQRKVCIYDQSGKRLYLGDHRIDHFLNTTPDLILDGIAKNVSTKQIIDFLKTKAAGKAKTTAYMYQNRPLWIEKISNHPDITQNSMSTEENPIDCSVDPVPFQNGFACLYYFPGHSGEKGLAFYSDQGKAIHSPIPGVEEVAFFNYLSGKPKVAYLHESYLHVLP